jgi:hypothetical protein
MAGIWGMRTAYNILLRKTERKESVYMSICIWEDNICVYLAIELLGLFWTLSIVLYVEDKIPQRFGDWICLRPQVDGAG